MRKRSLPLWAHGVLLVAFSAGCVCLWMLPSVLAGFPAEISSLIRLAAEFSATGVFTENSSEVLLVLMHLLHPLISWESVLLWSFLNAVLFALGLPFLWWVVQRVFNTTTAWLTVGIYALMPMYWYLAVRLDGYAPALTLLFAAAAWYVWFEKRRYLALTGAGLLLGLCIAAKSAFITFVPWLGLAYLWRYRNLVCSLPQVLVFGAMVYVGMSSPVLMQFGLPMSERIVQLAPGGEERTPGAGHLYPDDFVFTQMKEEFDAYTNERIAGASFLERQEDVHYRMIFGLEERSLWARLSTGTWFFMNNIPPLFLQETVGGAFLWVFIGLGLVTLFAERRQLAVFLVGLWLSMELLIRFVLNFGRDHSMNIGWLLALLAAVGVTFLVQQLHKRWPPRVATALSVFLVLCIALQLAQSARKNFTRLYTRSTVPEVYASEEVLNALPETALVAHPRRHDLFVLSGVEHVSIHAPTLTFLETLGRTKDPFAHYGVTHIYGYSEADTARITKAYPAAEVVPFPERSSIPLSRLTKYVLHLVR